MRPDRDCPGHGLRDPEIPRRQTFAALARLRRLFRHVRATVARRSNCRRPLAGVERTTCEIDLIHVRHTERSSEMRRVPGFIKRAPRIDLRRPAVLIDSQGVETVVTILDVSSGGFKFAADVLPRIGEVFILRVDGSDDIETQIRWAIDGQAGGVFLTEVDYSALP